MSRDSLILEDWSAEAWEHTVLRRHRLEEQFGDFEQQHDAAALGMWLFLATEVMFFGALFTALGVYRFAYGDAFEAASAELNWRIAAANTVLLLLSSLAMALAAYFAQTNQRRRLVASLFTAVALGGGFLLLKGFEYYEDLETGLAPGRFFAWTPFREAGLRPEQAPQVELFLLLYWIMTSLHALHVILGMGFIATIGVLAARGQFDADYHSPVEAAGLYWHFVDIVWIFLLPMLYLLGTHGT